MKGIKECLGWMVDNPLKAITNGDYEVKYIEKHDQFQKTIVTTLEDGRISHHTTLFNDFYELNRYEWTVVVKPADIYTALKDCEETGQRYVIMGKSDPIVSMDNIDGDVQLFSLIKGFIITDMWIPVD